MIVSLTDELIKDLVQKKVASGAFPSEQAVIDAALRQFLLQTDLNTPVGDVPKPPEVRLPGAFFEDQAVCAPIDLLRPGPVFACIYIQDEIRFPDLFPGE
jgi:hypothetical protein